MSTSTSPDMNVPISSDVPDSVWRNIAEKIDSHAYMEGITRTVQRVEATGEVFTPTDLVVEMLKNQPADIFGPRRTVLDPACGDGQFLVAVKWLKILHHRMTEEDALRDLYGVDIMRDNVDICYRRLDGGTILMGDTLHPTRRIPGQTDDEHQLMLSLFASEQDS